MVQRAKEQKARLSGPVKVALFFAILAIVLTLVGLWRADNLSLRNTLLAIVLCGGTWGLVSWAIATAVVQVEEDVASRKKPDD
ncbi:MAG: hypothetical protein ACUVR2_01180 [Anaerolineae bacterium]